MRAGVRTRNARRRWRPGLAAALALGVPAGVARAQLPQPAPPPSDSVGAEAPEPVATLPDGTRRVRGRVVTPRDSQSAGVPGVWVTLHRVGRDAAGPLDSVRTDAGGRYAFTYRPRGEATAVYFVSASHGGIAYFTSPLRGAAVAGEAAEVMVFDTTSRAVPLTVRGHHVIVARPDDTGAREVLEVFELSNDSAVTVVPPMGSPRGVWTTTLPRGARAFAVRESGDVPADGLVATGGAATLLIPVAPGLKQVAFSYRLAADALPLRVPVARATGVLEVLLEEAGGGATGAGLRPVAPVALEGKTFRRYLAQDAPAGATVAVTAGTGGGRPWPRVAVPVLLVALGGGMTAALLATARRRTRPPTSGARATPGVPTAGVPSGHGAAQPTREELLAALAALDDAFAARGDQSPAERQAYEAERRALKAALSGALAGAGTAG